MMFLKLLLNVTFTFLAFIFVASTAPVNDKPLNLLYNDVIHHYNIKLIPFYDGNIFDGECNISITIVRPTQQINFNSTKLCINDITLINSTTIQELDDKKLTVHKPIDYWYNDEANITETVFTDQIPQGNYILNIKFVGAIADNGGFRTFNVKYKDKM